MFIEKRLEIKLKKKLRLSLNFLKTNIERFIELFNDKIKSHVVLKKLTPVQFFKLFGIFKKQIFFCEILINDSTIELGTESIIFGSLFG